jgi:hypothetical protein
MLEAINQALAGLNAGFDQMNRAAAKIARDGAGGDLEANIVSMMEARQNVRANSTVVRTADKTIGTLIDVLA